MKYILIFLLSFLINQSLFSQYSTVINYNYTEDYKMKDGKSSYQVFVLSNDEELVNLYIYHKEFKNYQELVEDKDYKIELQYSSALLKNKNSETYLGIKWLSPYGNVLYKDEVQHQKWKLGTETKSILGYLCTAATTEFRGRIWKAWFTTEIPENMSPWKLSGLPGSILEAADEEQAYKYIALSVERNVNVTLPTKITNYYSKKDKAVPYRKYVEKEEEQQEIMRQQFISNLPKGTMLTAPDLKQKRKIDLEREYEWEIEN